MTRITIAAVTAAALATAACNPLAVGAGVGAGFGGILTAALGGNPQQIAIGTLIGGAGGLIVSAAVQAQNQPGNVCQAVDQFGRLIYVAPNGQPTTTPTPYPLLINC
jgi:hypothetical protein